MKKKRDLVVKSRLSGNKTSSEKFIISDKSPKLYDVISGRFVLFQKLHLLIHSWHYKLFHFHMSFESGKCGKEAKSFLKNEYLANKKSFLDEIKSIFHTFLRAITFGEKIKNSGQKLYSKSKDHNIPK